MSTKANIEFTKTWEFVDVIDNDIPPGAFNNGGAPPQPINVYVGSTERTVFALNWNHAIFMAFRDAAEAAGGDMHKCELCGANLRYAAVFEETSDKSIHVVGQECCKRVQEGVEDREEWVIVRAMKDAKELMTKNGLRWKVDLMEPEGFGRIPYKERPTYVSTWTPRGNQFTRRPKTRVTVWASSQAELYEKVKDFRLWLAGMNMNTASRVSRFGGF